MVCNRMYGRDGMWAGGGKKAGKDSDSRIRKNIWKFPPKEALCLFPLLVFGPVYDRY